MNGGGGIGGGMPIPKTRVYATETDINIIDGITITETDENNIIEGAARSKVSRSSATSESLGLSGTSPFSSTLSLSKSYSLVLILCLLFCNSFRVSLLQTWNNTITTTTTWIVYSTDLVAAASKQLTSMCIVDLPLPFSGKSFNSFLKQRERRSFTCT